MKSFQSQYYEWLKDPKLEKDFNKATFETLLAQMGDGESILLRVSRYETDSVNTVRLSFYDAKTKEVIHRCDNMTLQELSDILEKSNIKFRII